LLPLPFPSLKIGACKFEACTAPFGRRDHEGRAMNDQTSIEAAAKRLAQALDTLEAAVERRREADRGQSRLEDQVQALGADRSRLASELDSQAARARKLESTNRDIARRLDTAMENIRSVLDVKDR
jgi:septal ring factor EnvC (AmiA/AmiB activator)